VCVCERVCVCVCMCTCMCMWVCLCLCDFALVCVLCVCVLICHQLSSLPWKESLRVVRACCTHTHTDDAETVVCGIATTSFKNRARYHLFHQACLGLARTVYIHRIWPHIWWNSCKKHCIPIHSIYMVLSNPNYLPFVSIVKHVPCCSKRVLCCSKHVLCCSKRVLCCSKRVLCCSTKRVLCCSKHVLCCSNCLLCCSKLVLCYSKCVLCCSTKHVLCYSRASLPWPLCEAVDSNYSAQVWFNLIGWCTQVQLRLRTLPSSRTFWLMALLVNSVTSVHKLSYVWGPCLAVALFDWWLYL
jgi:hypothetical protein